MIRRIAFFAFVLAAGAQITHAQQNAPLRLIQTIPLPNIHGRIDHFDVDVRGQRLFMSALVYAHAGSLMALAFDLSRMEVTGSPAPILEGVVTTAATSGGAEYDVTESGLLAYVPGNSKLPGRSLDFVCADGAAQGLQYGLCGRWQLGRTRREEELSGEVMG